MTREMERIKKEVMVQGNLANVCQKRGELEKLMGNGTDLNLDRVNRKASKKEEKVSLVMVSDLI